MQPNHKETDRKEIQRRHKVQNYRTCHHRNKINNIENERLT